MFVKILMAVLASAAACTAGNVGIGFSTYAPFDVPLQQGSI
jgi:hypothetical protein